MALTAPRLTPQREPSDREFVVAAGAAVQQGGLVALNAAGALVPGSVATTLIAVGVALNSAAAGETVRVRRGCWRFENSTAGDAITATEIGKDVFIVDDETVAKTNGTNTRSRAGVCFDVDAQGVWVIVG